MGRSDVPSEPIFDGRLVACKEVRRDACFVVVAAYFPRLLKQPPCCGSITFDRHPSRAEGDYGVVGVYGHKRVVSLLDEIPVNIYCLSSAASTLSPLRRSRIRKVLVSCNVR